VGTANPPPSLKVSIIGASSYVGARLYSDLRSSGFETVGTCYRKLLFPELTALDIRDSDAVTDYLLKTRPDVVVLASAFSNQASVQKDPLEAEKVNIEGCGNVVSICNRIGAHVVYLSSEAAFSETDYGRLKRRAEEIVLEAKIPPLVLQLGMCFGMSPNTENDRPHNRLLRALEGKGSTEFDSTSKYLITYLPHLSRVVSELLNREHWRDTIPVICSEPASRYEIAKHVLEPLGTRVEPATTAAAAPLAPISDSRLQALGLETLSIDVMLAELASALREYQAGLGAQR
jgi:dTDP-4-dehydrorhamnose reductase